MTNSRTDSGIRYDIDQDLKKIMDLAKPYIEGDNVSQAEIIKQYLKAGNTITTIEAFKLFNITSLAQRIYDLRYKHNLIIDGETVTKNGKRFTVYSWNKLNDLPPAERLKNSLGNSE